MEAMLLVPTAPGKPAPPAAAPTLLTAEQSWQDARQLGGLGYIFDQDTSNIAALQKGLKAAKKPGVTLAAYQESRIRHFAHTLSRYLAGEAVR
jgi:hypothetical protein